MFVFVEVAEQNGFKLKLITRINLLRGGSCPIPKSPGPSVDMTRSSLTLQAVIRTPLASYLLLGGYYSQE